VGNFFLYVREFQYFLPDPLLVLACDLDYKSSVIVLTAVPGVRFCDSRWNGAGCPILLLHLRGFDLDSQEDRARLRLRSRGLFLFCSLAFSLVLAHHLRIVYPLYAFLFRLIEQFGIQVGTALFFRFVFFGL